MSHDAKHAVKDQDKPFVCPYGSCKAKFGKPGRKDFGSHSICSAGCKPGEKKQLPAHLTINLAATPPLFGKLRLDEPTYKDYGFDDPAYEGWINTQGVVAPPSKAKVPRKAKASHGKHLDYSKLVYWIEELAVRVGEQVQRFASCEKLVSYFLSGKNLKVLHVGKDWLPTLTIELNRRERTPERFHVKYVVAPYFECFDIQNYAIERLDDFERCNRFIFKLMGMNLTEKLTAAQLGYEYWWSTEGSKCDIRTLQNEEHKMAAAGYYGARVSAVKGKLRSSEAKEIEAGMYSYEELLNEGAVEDVWLQLDVTSMYPYLMKNWYPVGLARRSERGADEFANGVMGFYEVEYTRPPGLKLAILPVKNNKRLDWITEPGTGSGIYTDVDLRLALKYGYRLKFKGSCLCWDAKSHPYDRYVDTLFALRQSESDEAVRDLIKHLLVTLYGKMAQKESGTIANLKRITEDEMAALLDAGRWNDFVDENGTYYMRDEATAVSGGKQPTKPNHLGCYILSYSRVFMAELFHAVDYKYLATRTDSLLVAYPEYVKLREGGYLGTGLGKLKVEWGVIYETRQHHATSYEYQYMNSKGVCQPLVKGVKNVKNATTLMSKPSEVEQVSLEEEDFDHEDDAECQDREADELLVTLPRSLLRM